MPSGTSFFTVRVSEFEYLYNKNNNQQLQQGTLDDYLGMFINYKLKVAVGHAGIGDAGERCVVQGLDIGRAAVAHACAEAAQHLVYHFVERAFVGHSNISVFVPSFFFVAHDRRV